MVSSVVLMGSSVFKFSHEVRQLISEILLVLLSVILQPNRALSR